MSKRLTDIFNKTNKIVRKRGSNESTPLSRTLDLDGLKSRFRRNMKLVDPNGFKLLADSESLQRHGLFAVYKPPFAPMRRIDAAENFHRVSLESYLDAALRSEKIAPILVAAKSDEAHIQVRVLNNIHQHASGTVAICVGGADHRPSSMISHYEVLVHGHVNIPGASLRSAKVVTDHGLLQSIGNIDFSEDSLVRTSVQSHSFYGGHLVSLIRMSIHKVMSPSAPDVCNFLQHVFGFVVVGNLSTSQTASSHLDSDFPRVFINLRRISVTAEAENSELDQVDFSCEGSFEPLLSGDPASSRRICITDGVWVPDLY